MRREISLELFPRECLIDKQGCSMLCLGARVMTAHARLFMYDPLTQTR